MEQLDGRATVGIVSVSMKDGVGTIQLLAIDKTHRGKGECSMELTTVLNYSLHIAHTSTLSLVSS